MFQPWLTLSSHSDSIYDDATNKNKISIAMNPADMLSRAADAEKYLKTIANKTRLMILCSLLENERSVTDLLANITVTQPVISQHLALLREAELVATRREGQTIYYRLADERVERTIALLYEFFCSDDDK